MRGGSHHRLPPLNMSAGRNLFGFSPSLIPPSTTRSIRARGGAVPSPAPLPGFTNDGGYTSTRNPDKSTLGVVFGMTTVHLRLDGLQSYPYLA